MKSITQLFDIVSIDNITPHSPVTVQLYVILSNF